MKNGQLLMGAALTLLLVSVPLGAYADGRRSDQREDQDRDRYRYQHFHNDQHRDWRRSEYQEAYRDGRDDWHGDRFDLTCTRCRAHYNAGQYRCNRCGSLVPFVAWSGGRQHNRPPGIYFYKDKVGMYPLVGGTYLSTERKFAEKRYIDRPSYLYTR